jgi:(p)ppGpp synthase/HD superfamily hydrolase
MAALANPLSERFDRALALAHKVHRQQARKGTQIPYIAHILGVAALVLEFGGGEDEAIGAILHDVLEDAAEHAAQEVTVDWLRDEIQRNFGPKVMEIVEHMTDATERHKPSWLSRKTKYIADLEHAPAPALLVSAADKLHNVQSLLRDYRRQGDALWARFNPEAGKSGMIGYYRALADVLGRRLPGALSNELGRAVTTLEEMTGERGAWPPAAST